MVDHSAGQEVRWLSASEREAWLAAAALMVKLPAALDAQLRADADLSLIEYMVMAALSEHAERSMPMSEIAQFASASLSRLSHTATRLEKRGYLERRRSPGPGRRTTAILTQAGYDKVVATAPGHVTEVRRLLIDAVEPDQLAALTGIGHAILARIEESPESDGSTSVC